MSNSTHRVNVVKIDELLPHPNADTLAIVYIEGYQVVVKKDNFTVGSLAIYVQPDTIVPDLKPFAFLWNDREFTGEVPEKYRRVTVRRFRKEWSEGLLMPLSDFGEMVNARTFRVKFNSHGVTPLPPNTPLTGVTNYTLVSEGDDVAELLGFTHYEEPDKYLALGTPGRKLTLWQRVLRFFGIQPKQFGPKNAPGVYDVESIKNYPRVFTEGEDVIVTEKIHGSNARYMFDGKTFWVGSHKKWWKDKSNIWWRVAEKYPWIEQFCREYPKHTLRGEVTPTQTGYQYNDTPEERLFVFDVQCPDGSYVDKGRLYGTYGLLSLNALMQLAPVVYAGPYDAALLKALAEGKSLVDGAKNIREGIVISSATERTVRGLGRAQLKLKSMAFMEKEGKA